MAKELRLPKTSGYSTSPVAVAGGDANIIVKESGESVDTAEFVFFRSGTTSGASGKLYAHKAGVAITAPASEFDHLFSGGNSRYCEKK